MPGPEKTFQDRILPKLKALPRSYWVKIQKAEGGTPDILGCVRGRFVALELKRDLKHKPTKLQQHQMIKIKAAEGICWVVCPETWDEQLRNLKELAETGSF